MDNVFEGYRTLEGLKKDQLENYMKQAKVEEKDRKKQKAIEDKNRRKRREMTGTTMGSFK